MNVPRKQRGEGAFATIFWLLIIGGFAYWLFWPSKSAEPVKARQQVVAPSTQVQGKTWQDKVANIAENLPSASKSEKSDAQQVAQPVAEQAHAVAAAKDEGFWKGLFTGAGILAGGWFIAAGAGWFATSMFWALLFLPAIAIAILSERSDPRNRFWFEDEDDDDSYQFPSYVKSVSIICVATIFLLNWGGIPIWSTFAGWSWYLEIGAVVGYIGLGFIWSFKRWDDLSLYLHGRRAKFLQGGLNKAVEHLVVIQESTKKLRLFLKLDVGAPIPFTSRDLRGTTAEGLGDECNHQREMFYEGYLSLDEKNIPFGKEISDEQIASWLVELKTGYPPELEKYFGGQAKKAPEVSANEHKGQIYLWTVFWPFSAGFRIVRKIITLRLLRDLFVWAWKYVHTAYDKIGARNEVKFEMAKRKPMVGDSAEPTAENTGGSVDKSPVG